MRKLFNRKVSDSEITTLKEKLAATREEAYDLHQAQANECESIRARNAAKLQWLEDHGDEIKDKYIDLVLAFERGDLKNARRVIFSLGEIENAVLSMQVIDHNGDETTFADWAKRAFGDEVQANNIIAKIEKTLSADKTPPFDEIEEKIFVAKPEYEEIDDGFFANIKGSYKQALEEAIESAAFYSKLSAISFRARKVEAEDSFKQKEENSIDDFSQEMLVVATLVRLDDALTGNESQISAGLKNYLPYLIKNYGFEETIDHFSCSKDDAPSVIAMLTEKSTLMLDDPQHPLQIFLNILPDDLRRATFLQVLSMQVENQSLVKALKNMAIDFSGAYSRADELSLFVPSQIAPIYPENIDHGWIEESDDVYAVKDPLKKFKDSLIMNDMRE